MKISDLKGKKLAELKDIARTMSLSGFSTLRKQDLIYLIIEAQAEAVSGTDNDTAQKPRSRPKPGAEAKNGPAATPRPAATVPEKPQGPGEIGRASCRERV